MRRAGSMSKGRRDWRQSRLLRVALITAAIAATYTLISWVQSSSFTEEELAARTRAVAKDNMREPEGPVQCHKEENAEYEGDQISWGFSDRADNAEACCDQCKADARCNVWAWCSAEAGCGGPSHPKGACWTKHLMASKPDLTEVPGKRGPGVPFTSGACYADNRRRAAEARIAMENRAEAARLAALAANKALPLVYFDVEVQKEAAGRMTFVLFTDKAPRAAENYRLLFSGEKGIVPEGHEGAGKAYSFNGTSFYRIIDRFIDQGGVNVDSPLPGGGKFPDDPGSLELLHDRKGLLSIANAGPNTNTAHFSIMQGPFAHNNKHYGVFGELVSGWDVALAVNRLSHGLKDNAAGGNTGAVIVAAGQLRRGTPVDVANL